MKIDPEFKALIPALSSQEYGDLELSIIAEGCRDRLVVWNDILLDGHNRYDICMVANIPFKTVQIDLSDRVAAELWILHNQLARRNINAYQRGIIAIQIEKRLRPEAERRMKAGKKGDPVQISAQGKTRVKAATAAGISHDTVAKVKDIEKEATGDEKKQLASNEKSVNAVYKAVKDRRTSTKRETKRKEAAAKCRTMNKQIIVGDFRDHADKIPDGSLSLIFTDPPYDRKAAILFDGLGEFADRKLAEGGSLICYVGQINLSAAMVALQKSLRYWWTICCLHSGKKTLMREYGIRAAWKPILWFVKGTRDNKQDIVTDVVSGGQEKEDHKWQQAELEAAYWIEHLTPKDGIVCDPFLGSGTTAIAANSLKRKWIGFEIDPVTAQAASARIGQ